MRFSSVHSPAGEAGRSARGASLRASEWQSVAFAVLGLASCGEPTPASSDAGPVGCELDPALETPRFEQMPSGIVEERAVRFQLRDPGEAIDAAELELWLAAGDGSLVQRVWSTTVPMPGGALGLDDGTFEPGFDGLHPWTSYSVRARFVQSETCVYGDWAELPSFLSDDGSAYFFSDQIHTLELEIEEPSWSSIAAEADAPWCEPYQRDYYSGTVVFEGERFESSGLRVKGGSGSSRLLSEKAGLKAHLAWDDPALGTCASERRLHGLKRLTLNNMVQDGSFIHETLGYRFYRELGVPAARTGHINVVVNGELWGLYLNVESFDRRFLARRYVSDRGMLFEGECGCDLVPSDVPSDGETEFCFQRKFDVDACADIREGDDPRSFSLLLELAEDLEALPDFYPAVRDYIDFDAFLSLWAADTILNSWDGYIFGVQHNYRIYHDPGTDLWSLIPGGIDQVLTYTTSLGTTVSMNAFNPNGILATRCLQDSECEAAFAARLHEAVDIFEGMDLIAAADELEARIAPHVEADPRREVSVEAFHARVQNVRSFVEQRPDEIRSQLTAHGY